MPIPELFRNICLDFSTLPDYFQNVWGLDIIHILSVIKPGLIYMNISHTDTSKNAEREFVRKMRLMDKKSKFKMLRNISSSVFSLSKRAVKRAYPELEEAERKIKFIELNYGEKLSRKYADYMKIRINE